eukprot:CAMPEP_0116006292 /NCGR_PEP_ID=MMETSP0321-20121206/1646_1 /TAXON_ID=163516 /ORGANISM="Leptocylindrus danicus var. danicus, Strain B650" /LENGTH=47 /DNA_ID= /DNA_START= /DNA_END= /DNA_ORIENTATION=
MTHSAGVNIEARTDESMDEKSTNYNEELLALIICLSDGTVKEDGFEF